MNERRIERIICNLLLSGMILFLLSSCGTSSLVPTVINQEQNKELSKVQEDELLVIAFLMYPHRFAKAFGENTQGSALFNNHLISNGYVSMKEFSPSSYLKVSTHGKNYIGEGFNEVLLIAQVNGTEAMKKSMFSRVYCAPEKQNNLASFWESMFTAFTKEAGTHQAETDPTLEGRKTFIWASKDKKSKGEVVELGEVSNGCFVLITCDLNAVEMKMCQDWRDTSFAFQENISGPSI